MDPVTACVPSTATALGGVGMAAVALVNPSPRAPSSAWLAVTRCWLLSFVFQTARNEGVVKKLTRGSRDGSVVVTARSAGRSNDRSGVPVVVIVTIRQSERSVVVKYGLMACSKQP